MSKGNGSTRASSSVSANGLTSGPSTNGASQSPEKMRKAVDRAGFKSSGVNGQWELDTPYGGAQILDETDTAGRTFGYKEYGVSAWDSEFNMIEDGQERGAKRFGSLNEAKQYAKELIKSRIR